MQTQACQPCAKRKVRCDREEPCSNCRRRKQDQCVYPEVSPTERIKQLESLVCSLRRGSEHSTPSNREQAEPKASSTRSLEQRDASNQTQKNTSPLLLRENGQSTYLESSTWHSWDSKVFDSSAALQTNDGYPTVPELANTDCRALQSILCRNPYIDITQRHPLPQIASALWDIFYQRVHPVCRILFNRELERIRCTAVDPNGPNGLTFQEHAFIFSVYLISVVSLSEDECSMRLEQSRLDLYSEFQMLCEQALAGSNFLGAADLITIQASIMYIFAGIEQMNTKSLWSLMGIVVRNAERCGLHRDGILLGLPPYETEKRRRVWWELQHLDMALGVKSGSMSLSLQASWDARLPLNIEDEEIEPSMREAPEEREGLTSMSQCLWTYWVLDLQRSFCHTDGTKLGFSWPAEKSLSAVEKNTLIDRLETGLNKRYVQFCDPIPPLHLLVQILARAFICGMRRLTLHPLAHNGKISDLSEDHRKRLLDVCIQGLEYDVALHSNPSLKHFRWRFQGYFQWSALVYVLIEARRQFDTPKAGRIWALLSDIYAANPGLSDLSDDRRKSYAVELMTAAWRARESFLLERQLGSQLAPQKPIFLSHLESSLSQSVEAGKPGALNKRKLGEPRTIESMPNKKLELAEDISCQGLPEETNALSQLDLATIADIDFDAIDCSFWESYS